jgi:hypothetical protein
MFGNFTDYDELLTTSDPQLCDVGDWVRVGIVKRTGNGWLRTEQVDIQVAEADGDRYRGKPNASLHFNLDAVGPVEFGPDNILMRHEVA